MLTNHRDDGEGNKTPKYIGGKSKELLSFIDECDSKDLEHRGKWLSPLVESYITVNPVNETYFSDKDRAKYWQIFENVSKQHEALVFVDPDTGLETGKPSYLRRVGREKYVFNNELENLYKNLDENSVLMIYQHLPNNKHAHEESVTKKVNQAISSTGCEFVLAYREDDLAFIFMMKNTHAYSLISQLVTKYHKNSGHKYKSLHITG